MGMSSKVLELLFFFFKSLRTIIDRSPGGGEGDMHYLCAYTNIETTA